MTKPPTLGRLLPTWVPSITRFSSGKGNLSTSFPSWCVSPMSPLADLACVPLHFVCKLAREHVKVVMSGEGADEILAGYDFEHLSRQLQRIYAARAFIPTSILRMASGLLRQHAWGRLLQLLAEVDKAGFLQSKAQHITRHFDEVEKAGLWLSGDRFRANR